MNWDVFRNFFRSRHVLWLEAEYKKLQERLESELAYERDLNQKLRDDLDRVRLFLQPGLQRIDLHPDTTPASADRANKEPVVYRTPWERVVAREMEADAKAFAEKQKEKELRRQSGKSESKGESHAA